MVTFKYDPFKVCCVLLILGIRVRTRVSQQMFDVNYEKLASFAIGVCENTVLQSQHKLIYVVNLYSNPSAWLLIKSLHNISIQTVYIDELEKLIHLANDTQRKNVLFFVRDTRESLSLILSSVSKENTFRGHSDSVDFTQNDFYDGSNVEKVINRKNHKAGNALPRYCLDVDGASLESNAEETCDYKVNITSDELEDLSVLSDPTFNLTRGLYSNNIWNSNNYIVFMVHKGNQMASNTLPFTLTRSKRPLGMSDNTTIVGRKTKREERKIVFKFFWRFFRGLKTIICERTFCERYNPFTEEIASYYGKESETYFDFSWDNMNGKPVGILFALNHGKEGVDDRYVSVHWSLYLIEVFEALQKSINCSYEPKNYLLLQKFDSEVGYVYESDIGQKYGVHLQSQNVIKYFESISTADVDYSVTVDSCVLCFLTPHSQLMPQYLVIFKAFSPVVWYFIVITITIFILMQHLFQFSQRKIFRDFYSDAERSSYEGASAMLTVFSYFICGSPPRLLLGRFYTGKVLFVVFSFTAIIISTVFLDGMTTLMTKQVRYPEIDSLKDMEDANIFIQVLDAEKASRFFLQENKYKTLATKLTNSSLLLEDSLMMESNEDWDSFQSTDYLTNWTNFTMNSTRMAEYKDYFMKNVMNLRTIHGSDAYLESISQAIISKQSISIERFLQGRPMSYHLVEECLMTYPLSFTFIKNSFLFEKFNNKLAQMLEAGHAAKYMQPVMHYQFNTIESGEPSDQCEPRPYELRDLRLAFMALLSGLFLSFLAFLVELYIEFFEN